jgi:hypothetical protein
VASAIRPRVVWHSRRRRARAAAGESKRSGGFWGLHLRADIGTILAQAAEEGGTGVERNRVVCAN